MKTTRILNIILILAVTVLFSSFQMQQDHKVLFEKAKYTMETKADLQGAIDLFENLIKKYPNEKEYVAKSLLYQGMCYERLGNQEAVKKYQRLVKNYPQQKNEVAYARDRLAKLLPLAKEELKYPLTPKFTKIKIPTKLWAFVALSPDGKDLALVSEDKLWKLPVTGNLGSEYPGIPIQLNTENVKVEPSGISWSGDGKWIAFNNAPKSNESSAKIPNQSIYRIPSNGGKPHKMVNNYRGSAYVNYRISLSPDGKNLAYTSIENNEQHIYTIPVTGGTPKQLVDKTAREPVFSPDGKWIAYVEDKNLGKDGGDLWIKPAAGGEPRLIAKAGKASSPVWSPDGKKIAFLDCNKNKQINLISLPESGEPTSKASSIEAPPGIEELSLLAGWTPDNKIGMVATTKRKFALFTAPSEGGQAAMIMNDDSWVYQPRWSPDGKQIYYTTAPGMGIQQGLRLKLASVSAHGGRGKQIPRYTNQYGDTIRTITCQGGNRVSPNGKMILSSVWTSKDKNPECPFFPFLKIWKFALDGSEGIQLTNKSGNYADFCPCWSPNGEKVAFIRSRMSKGSFFLNYDEAGIYIIDSSGNESQILPYSADKFFYSLAWSPDGKMLAYLTKEKETPNVGNLNIIQLETGATRIIKELPSANEYVELAWSPDSRRIAFNGEEIQVVNIDNGNTESIKTNLSDAIIYNMDWSPDGKRFVFGGLIVPKSEFWFLEDFLPPEEMAEQHFKKGNELFGRWEYESAIEEYKKALEPDPNSLLALNAQYCIGQTLFRQGKYDTALETFKKLIKENPQSNIAPVTELMISQVEYEMKNGEKLESKSYKVDENTIVSEQGITFRKYKTFVGRNDKITYATGGFNMSPDCRFLVLENTVVPMDGRDAFQLVDMNATRAVYSPDMTHITFFADSAIWIATVSPESGKVIGAPQKMLKGAYRYQGSLCWSIDGKKLAFEKRDKKDAGDIWTIDIENGKLTQLTNSSIKEGGPVWSPDNRSILFHKEHELWMASANGDNQKKLLENPSGNPTWSPDCRWILFHSNWENNYLYSIDQKENYEFQHLKEVGQFASFSPDGKKLYFYKPSYDDKWGMKIVSASGGPSFTPSSKDVIYGSQWSLDSKYIFAQSEDENGNIVCKVIPLNGGQSFIIDINSPDVKEPFYFTVSPNKKQLAFSVKKDNDKKDLYIVPISLKEGKTTGPARLIFKDWTGGAYNVTFSWSPDGDKIALIHNDDIWIVPLTGETSVQLTKTPENERWVSWSPDGRMISYHIESGQTGTIYTIPANGGDPNKVAKVDGPTTRWSPNSKSITIISNNTLRLASLNGETIKSINIPKEYATNVAYYIEYSPDGKNIAWINYNDDESYIITYSFEDKKFTKLASEDLLDYKYGLRWSPNGKWISYLTEEGVKVRPEGVLWEADFEEVMEKLLTQGNSQIK